MTLTPGSKLGPYEILSPLGAGGMGEVYRAKDSRLGREVAIKVLPESTAKDPEALARFEREAKAVAALSHPNILALHDIGTENDVVYAVMELLEGETLRARLQAGALPPRKALDYARQIAEGLAAAHEKGIIHRDLKPENLFILRDGRVKILDFGLAKVAAAADGAMVQNTPTRSVNTEVGMVMGTPGYMSPEQVRGQPADARSDLFALGAVLHEMASGRAPFKRATSADTMSAILNEEPPELPAQAPGGSALEQILRHCLEKEPTARFQSARDLAFQLEMLPAFSGSGPQRAADGKIRRRYPMLLAGCVIAALAAGAAWLLRRAPAAPPRFHRLTFRNGLINNARFAPDGSVVYGAKWEGEAQKLYLALPGQPNSRAYDFPDNDILAISATGEMLIFNQFGGGLMSRVGLTGGSPKVMLEGVHYGGADWAPDGKAPAVIHTVAGHTRLDYPPGHTLWEGDLNAPRFSPRGDQLAFWDKTGDGIVIGVGPAAGGARRILSGGWQFFSGAPCWRPDGKEIWFTAHRTGDTFGLYGVNLKGRLRLILKVPGGLELYDVSRDGRALLAHHTTLFNIKLLDEAGTPLRELSWLDGSRPRDLSADGKLLLFNETGEGSGGKSSVFVRRTDGAPAVLLGEGVGLALSPDGRWVLALLEQAGKSPPHFVLLPTGAGEIRPIANDRFTALNSGGWLPDGSGFLFAGQEQNGIWQLYQQPLPAGAPRRVTPETARLDFNAKAVSPDGKTAFAVDASGKLALFPIAGGAGRPLMRLPAQTVPLQWSGDSRAIFLLDRSQGALQRLDIASGKMATVLQLGREEAKALAIAQDGKILAYGYRRVISALYIVEGLR